MRIKSQLSTQPLPIRIFSHNIRYATSTPFTNEKPWPQRLPLILSQFAYHTRYTDTVWKSPHDHSEQLPSTGFICLQEVLYGQLVDILTGLNELDSPDVGTPVPQGPLWGYVGVGREDGKTKGEYSPILYPVQAFQLLQFKNVWLSPTPDRPSKGWDAGSTRILTVAVFEHKLTGQRLIACCTHLDNAGPVSRSKSVNIILETIKNVRAIEGDLPVFLAGDFNSFPTQEAYLKMDHSDFMTDIRGHVEPEKRYGDGKTFTAFRPDQDPKEQGRIDFIWLGPKQKVHSSMTRTVDPARDGVAGDGACWNVDGYAVLPNVFDDGVYCSDHRCVVGDAILYSG